MQVKLTFIFLLCLCSCEKSEPDDRELFDIILPIDSEILGDWHRSFSVRGDQNSITVYTDSLRFNTTNFGSVRHYKFRDLWFCDTFQFYNTTDSTIFLKYDEGNETWTYVIRNDSPIRYRNYSLH
jgi:hypothetical protein